MDKHIIIGVHVIGRTDHAADVQKVFTNYGCQIKTRIGLHDVHDDYCSPNGFILIEAIDAPATLQMIDALKALEGVDVKVMEFEH